jgi:hypothetical protein
LLREPGTLGSLGRRGSGLLHRRLERLLIERLLVVKVLGVGGIEVGAAREGLIGEIAVGSHIEKIDRAFSGGLPSFKYSKQSGPFPSEFEKAGGRRKRFRWWTEGEVG